MKKERKELEEDAKEVNERIAASWKIDTELNQAEKSRWTSSRQDSLERCSNWRVRRTNTAYSCNNTQDFSMLAAVIQMRTGRAQVKRLLKFLTLLLAKLSLRLRR